MDRRSELPSVAAAGVRRDLQLEKRLESNRTSFNEEPTTRVFTKRFGLGRVAQPNESRLSCGAKLTYSQMEFYHTARRTFAGLFEEGRRQLQALLGCAPQVIARVRPRQERRGALAITCLTPGL